MTPILQFSTRETSLDEVLDNVPGTFVEVTRAGRVSGVLVDPDLFKDLMSSYRRSLLVADLSDDVFENLMKSEPVGENYSLDDLPEVDQGLGLGR